MIRRIRHDDAPAWLTPPLDVPRTPAIEQARANVSQARAAQQALVQLERQLAARVQDAVQALAVERVTAVDVEHVVAHELARLRRAHTVKLVVHPSDAASLDLAQLQRESDLAGALELETDAALARGSARLESNLGDCDALLETRLALAIDVLFDGRQRR